MTTLNRTKVEIEVYRHTKRHRKLAEAQRRLDVQRMFETEDQRRQRANLEKLHAEDWSVEDPTELDWSFP